MSYIYLCAVYNVHLFNKERKRVLLFNSVDDNKGLALFSES